jgi:MoxR-like ATPase
MEVVAESPGPERFERAGAISDRLVDNIETVVYGKRDEIKLVLTALACDGHVLLEDVPGTAKTMLARAIAGSIEGAIPQRIQCTPDLQPTDVTGLSVFDQRTRGFEFRPGPIFANVVLVDEINRATPKTQSALLEAMAERQVTVDGVTRELPYPFLLLATENPIEYEGTFPLPEAQLDRFFLRTALGYPGVEDELRILTEQRYAHPLDALEPVVGLDEVHELRAAAQHVYVDDALHRWVVELVRATREQESVVIGSSVRGSLALERFSMLAATSSRRTSSACSRRCSSTASSSPPASSRAPVRPAGRRRSRSFARAVSSSLPSRAPKRIRSSKTGSDPWGRGLTSSRE